MGRTVGGRSDRDPAATTVLYDYEVLRSPGPDQPTQRAQFSTPPRTGGTEEAREQRKEAQRVRTVGRVESRLSLTFTSWARRISPSRS
jgi:hypothetical protein